MKQLLIILSLLIDIISIKAQTNVLYRDTVVNISSTDLANSQGTPIVLLPSKGVGEYTNMWAGIIVSDYKTTAFNSQANNSMRIAYGLSGYSTGPYLTGGFNILKSPAKDFAYVPLILNTGPDFQVLNSSVVMRNLWSVTQVGDMTAKAHLLYQVSSKYDQGTVTSPFFYKTLKLTPYQATHLNSTPQKFVDAPGTGKLIRVVSVTTDISVNSSMGSGDLIYPIYGTSGGIQAGSFASSREPMSKISMYPFEYQQIPTQNQYTTAQIENAPIYLEATGDHNDEAKLDSVKYTMVYQIIDLTDSTTQDTTTCTQNMCIKTESKWLEPGDLDRPTSNPIQIIAAPSPTQFIIVKSLIIQIVADPNGLVYNSTNTQLGYAPTGTIAAQYSGNGVLNQTNNKVLMPSVLNGGGGVGSLLDFNAILGKGLVLRNSPRPSWSPANNLAFQPQTRIKLTVTYILINK